MRLMATIPLKKRGKYAMQQRTLVQLTVGIALAALMVLAAVLPSEAQVRRLVFASAGLNESNRFWTIVRPSHLQYDPFLETLLDLDPETGAYIPRLAEKWEATPDMKEWTFFLRKGVQFHFGYGEFTARDVVHAHSLMIGPDALATLTGFWRSVEEIKVINDYQVVFRMKQPATTMPYAASRSGDLRMVSKAQWDKEGLEGFEKRPAGTGSYRYVSRKVGQSIVFERVENHWRGERPDFPELEIRFVPEDTTRLATLLNGEAHVVDLPRELQPEAINRGMKIVSSKLATDWETIYFGGQFYIPGDPKHKADMPWNDRRVRQAMNMAVNRKELRETIFRGKGTPMYVSGFEASLEGWNPAWVERFDTLYGYNPSPRQRTVAGSWLSPWHDSRQIALVHQSWRGRASTGGRSPGGLF